MKFSDLKKMFRPAIGKKQSGPLAPPEPKVDDSKDSNEPCQVKPSTRSRAFDFGYSERREMRRKDDLLGLYCLEENCSVPIIEASSQGARVVIDSSWHPGEMLNLTAQTENSKISVVAKIAWLEKLSTGKAVAGLCFQ